MDKELYDYTAERAQILATASSSKQETAQAAKDWLEATAGADEVIVAEATEKFLDYLDGRPNSIDGLIAFAQGPAVELMGAEAAAGMAAAGIAAKEAGTKYCICDSCTAASQILAKHGRIEL